MAKNKFDDVIEKMIQLESEEKNYVDTEKPNGKKVGRPKSKDLASEKKTRKTTLVLTEELLYKITVYSFENKMDKSEAVRYILNNFFSNEQSSA